MCRNTVDFCVFNSYLATCWSFIGLNMCVCVWISAFATYKTCDLQIVSFSSLTKMPFLFLSWLPGTCSTIVNTEWAESLSCSPSRGNFQPRSATPTGGFPRCSSLVEGFFPSVAGASVRRCEIAPGTSFCIIWCLSFAYCHSVAH